MDELSPGARSLLQAADSYDDPSAEDADRVRRAVLARVGAISVTAAAVATASTQAKAASAMTIAAKLGAALAVTAGGVAATWTYVTHDREAPAIVAPAPAPKAKVPQVMRPMALPAPEALVATPEVAPAETSTKAARALPRAPRGEVAADKPGPANAAPTPADLEAEMRLIRGADAALRSGRAADALPLLAKHQAEHPRASLAHEREGLRAIAQCQLGAAGSSDAALRFITRSPRSPLAARLRSACRILE